VNWLSGLLPRVPKVEEYQQLYTRAPTQTLSGRAHFVDTDDCIEMQSHEPSSICQQRLGICIFFAYTLLCTIFGANDSESVATLGFPIA